MVTPTINTMQAFDTYYSGKTQKTDSSELNTFNAFLIGGLILTSACAIYFAIKNNDLKKRTKFI